MNEIKDFEFEKVVKEDSVVENLKDSLRSAMFNTVVLNTIRRGTHVTPETLEILADLYIGFALCDNVKIITSSDSGEAPINCVYNFDTDNDGEWIREAILLCNRFNEDNIFVEDIIENGFCCINENGFVKVTHD